MKSAGATTYLVNGLGQRVKKSTASVDTYFAYDEAGRLIGEYDTAGAAIQETVWLGDLPVAVIKPATPSGFSLFYVWADHLGTPRQITDTSNVSRWEWAHNDPFGNNAPNEDPASAGAFNFNLRFPGQYYDVETAKHYNYFRDYDPSLGRYVESDPVGLKAGFNTYGYVRGNSLNRLDRLGLADSECGQNEDCCRGVPGGGSEFGGTVMCCSGRKVACTYCNDTATKGGQIRCGCKMKHEIAHVPDVECTRGGNYRPNFSAGKYPSSECKAYDVEMNCLMKGLGDCGNDIECQFTLQDRLSVMVIGRGTNHGCR